MKRLLPILPLLLCACVQRMGREGHLRPYAATPVLPAGTAAQLQPEGTIARGQLASIERPPLDRALIARGRERFEIYCAPCHGLTGYGDGPVTQRGLTPPPSYHSDRLRGMPDQHFYDVMSRGFGAMFSYADRVTPHDRWAITAYIRALQLSQDMPAARLTPAEQKSVEEGKGS